MSVNRVHSDGTLERVAGLGVGIKSVDVDDGHLIVTYDDNTTHDAGEVGGGGSGDGDMRSSVYDPNGTVAEAGGIEEYVETHGGSMTDLEKFNQNIIVEHARDTSTGTNYTSIRIFKKKIDGTEQHPFVRAISPSKPRCSALDLTETEDWCLIINSGLGRGDPQPIDGPLIQNGDIVYNAAATYHAGSMPLTIDANGDLSYASSDATGDELLEQGAVAATCGFSPIILNYEEVPISSFPTDTFPFNHYLQRAQRQIIGQYGNGDYAIITCEGRSFDNSSGWKIAEAQAVCKKLGLKFAYNLDGGGSTQTVIGKKQLNTIYEYTTGRKLPSFIVFNGTTNMGVDRLPKTLVNIRAEKTTTVYEVGSTLTTDDIVVSACYSEGTITDVTSSATINTSAVDMATVGSYAITVTYTESGKTITKSIDISVISDEPVVKTLDHITATKTKTNYDVNDTLATNDIVVTAYYTDSTSAVVTSSAVIDSSNVDMTTVGNYTISVSYTEDEVTKTASITITVSEPSTLPEGYTQLESARAAGYQYINTGINGDDIKRCVYEISISSDPTSGGHVFSGTNMFMPLFKSSGSSKTVFANYLGTESTAAQGLFDYQLNTKYKIEFNDGSVYVDDNLIFTISKGNKSSSANMCLCTYGGAPTDTRYRFSGRIYSFKCYNRNDELIADYIPAKDSSNVVGFYDLVSRTFKKSNASAFGT